MSGLTRYVCNACESLTLCPLPKHLYQARATQRHYEKIMTDSRKGINMTPEELRELNNLIGILGSPIYG